jgi:uncharacterized protein
MSNQGRLFVLLTMALAIVLLLSSNAPVYASSTTIVISEFRVRGPNGAADEFIELYNLSSSPVDISGWLIRGSNASGSVSTRATILPETILDPGCYYLVTNSSTFGGPYSGSVPGDQTFGTGITDDGGIALMLPDGETIIDQVGMSNGSAYKEGTPLASLGSSNLDRGYERKPGGAAGSGVDTDDNSSDFHLISPSDPQNSTSPCVVSGEPEPTSPLINEFVFNHIGTDTHEFVEIFGAPDTDYSDYTILQIEGDGAGAGVIDSIHQVGTTDANGFWTTGFLANVFENGTVTLLLVKDFTGSVGQDLDTNNDGILDVTPWSSIVDDVAVSDGGAGDLTYASTVLAPGFNDSPFTPGGASRIPNGVDTDSVDDWVLNDFDGAGLPGFDSTPAPGVAFNTPGAENALVLPPEPEGAAVVISQVYGGGGNSGAPFTHDYVELFNAGLTSVSLDGLSIQYASATGSGNFGANAGQLTALPDVTVEPGQYFLVQQAGGSVGEPLPSPDYIDPQPINLAGASGKVALVTGTDSLGCNGGSTACGPEQLERILDLVGYGTANFFEGSGAAPQLSNSLAAFRAEGGCQDTDDNAADFTAGSPAPRNSASPLNVCLPPEGDILAVNKSGPAIATIDDVIDYILVVSNVASNIDADNVVITDTLPADVTFIGFESSSAVTLVSGDAPDIVWAVDTLPAGEDLTLTLTVQINDTFAAAITNAVVVSTATPEEVLGNNSDTAVTSPPVGGSCGQPFTPIYEIQGSGSDTPIPGPVTTEGIVIGDYEGPQPNLRGFYIQDLVGDGDPETSDGIFVFNFDNDNVNLGDAVRVSGTAGDFQGQTQISGVVTLLICDTDQTIEPTNVYLPFPEPVNDVPYLERYEGMLVRLPQMLYVTEHFQLGRFGQIVMSSGDRLYQPTHLAAPGDDALAIQAENDLNRIIIDDELNNQNPDPIFFGRGGNQLTASNTLRGGDTAENIVGVMTFTWAGNAASGNAYRVRPINALGGGVPNFQPANPRPAEPADVGGTLKVAAFNLLNYFNTFSGCTGGVGGAPMDCRGADNLTEFNRQWPKTVEAILGMDVDVLGVIEIENDGYGPDSAIQDLVNRLNDATAPGTFAFIDADAETGEINALGTDAIKVGLLYRPANVSPVGQTAVLNTEAFVNGGDADPRNRATIAQAFEQNTTGARFIVNVHHLKSKGSACEDPDLGDGQGNCAVVRTNAVLELMDWLYTDPTGTGETDILIIGDLNSYAQEDPIQAILEFGYVNLVEELLGPQAYSYVFDGQWGYLDYALASPTLFAQVTGVTEWNINADEPNVLDYNTNFKSANHVEILYAPDQFRSSDHDPILIGLHLHYIFSGFFPPVENPPEFNVVRAGSSIPIKFSLNGDMGLDILAPGSPSSHEIACTSGSGDGSEPGDYASSTSSLTYDPVADQYIYVWQTDSAWANTCRQFTLGLDDGTEHILYFRFR